MRTFRIQNVYINDLSNSSIFLCGSSEHIQSRFVEKKEVFQSSTWPKDHCDQKEELQCAEPSPVWLNVKGKVECEILSGPQGANVCIEDVKVLSMSSGTTFQIGNNSTISLESYMKKINS